MQIPFSRIPPHNIDAEQSVLCGMLLDREAVTFATEILKSDDFYRPDHKEIFEGMIELYKKAQPIDLITLANKLQERGTLEQVGGQQYLMELSMHIATSANLKQHAKIIEQKSILRKLIHTSQDIMGKSYEGGEDIQTIIDEAEKGLFNIIQNRRTEEFSSIKDVLIHTFEKIENIYHTKGQITGVPSGFIDLDRKTTGFQPSDFILVAARPSMGKTAFSLNICQHAAVHAKVPVAIFSLEMSKDQLVNRMLSAEAMVDSQKLRTGGLEEEDWAKIARAMGPLSEAPIYIDDTPGITVGELRAKCRKLKLEKGLGLIMIDYLQLMSGNGKESRQQEISEISRSLKAVARELSCPVIALSQLSRAVEQRADHRPMLSDLRESGAIEQDADVVMFLYRDEYYHPDTEKKNQGEVIIAKQRNGPIGTVDLVWLGQFTRFANLQRNI